MNKKITRVISCILSTVLVLSVLSTGLLSVSAVGGSCGSGLTWSFNESTGALTVSGAGKMTEWDKAADVPWSDYMDDIKSAVIGSGVQNVGNFAFCFAGKLASVTLPESVTSIGKTAFWECSSLTAIALPKALKSIGEGAFLECNKITTVTLPSSVALLGTNTFAYCVRLSSAVIQGGVTAIPELMFAGCTSLKTLSLPASLKSVGRNSFLDCGSLSTVNYASTEDNWKKVSISSVGNSDLLGANFSFSAAPDATQVDMFYKAVKTLSVSDAEIISWNSSNSNIVSVNDSVITARATGSAVITATSSDGVVYTFNVNVSYAWWQLIIIYVLFGWAWY